MTDGTTISRQAETGNSTASLIMAGGTVDLQPSTPPRGRVPSRYPASLARGDPGRVPLHRRGTSKTYERLEDLLREAGYKETRIFTPESERREVQAEAERKSSVKGGVDMVVGYLSSWMPSAGRNSSPLSPKKQAAGGLREEALHRSLPSSPLAHKRALHHDGITRAPSPLLLSPSASASTIASMRSHTSDSSDGHIVSYKRVTQQIIPPAHLLRPQSSASGNLRTYAQVSAAQGYLRHMASAPNMPKRLPSTRDSSVSRVSVFTNDTAHPALPPRWLDSVANAVVGSGHPRAHIGGPQSTRHLSRPSSRAPRPKREGKFTLSDQTNRPAYATAGRSASGAPPGLTSYLSRAEIAPSAVSAARVMCRSAPASRSSSRVGDRTAPASLRRQQRGELTNKGSHKGRRQSKCDGVPTLASTCIENDAWGTHWVNGQRVPLSFTDGREELAVEDDGDGVDDDDDDDEGELDFARLLVPPKRQYSIQSLRRHLHNSRSNLREPHEAWEDEDEFGTRVRGRRDPMDDGEGHGWEAMGVPGFNNAQTKRRRGLPGGWANLSTRS